jgi:hypothetical protein
MIVRAQRPVSGRIGLTIMRRRGSGPVPGRIGLTITGQLGLDRGIWIAWAGTTANRSGSEAAASRWPPYAVPHPPCPRPPTKIVKIVHRKRVDPQSVHGISDHGLRCERPPSTKSAKGTGARGFRRPAQAPDFAAQPRPRISPPSPGPGSRRPAQAPVLLRGGRRRATSMIVRARRPVPGPDPPHDHEGWAVHDPHAALP